MKKIASNFLLSLIALALCGIPLWIWLGVHSITSPQGFWQELIIGALGAYFLGGLQFIGLILFVVALVAIWFD